MIDAAALGRSRGARGRLRQDPHVRDARGVPQAAAEVRLLPREVDHGVRGQGERRVDVAPAFYKSTRAAGTSRSATPIRIDERLRAARPCSSPSTPKATTSGTPRRAGIRRSRTLTRSAACTTSSRAMASGRRTSSPIRWPPTRDRPRCCADCSRGVTAEIGAHHHAWETPPFSAEDVDRHPYALSLPLAQFDAQLASLTGAIDHGGGRAARVLPIRPIRLLGRARLIARASRAISSTRAWRRSSTKRTRAARISSTRHSRRTSSRTTTRPGPARATCWSCPISAALNRRVPRWLERAYGRAPWPYTTKRVLRLARIAHVRWLRPSYSSADDMIALARQLADAASRS